tara:strand:+ start:121 stop:285 length:165 start_codon:yes stop_codon:yes gene_type:complete
MKVTTKVQLINYHVGISKRVKFYGVLPYDVKKNKNSFYDNTNYILLWGETENVE